MPMRIRITNNHSSTKIIKKNARRLVENILADEKITAKEINIILVPDDYLRKLHKDYLQDDSYTDVMTFDLSDNHTIEGEIYIAPNCAKIHAREFAVAPEVEIGRLIIHGLLHLKGFDDATETQQAEMRSKEDYYLEKYVDLLNLL